MKKTFALSLLIFSSTILTAQENFKKCLTTQLVEQELLSNPDYAEGRAKSIAETSAWLASNHAEKTTINIPVVIHVIHRTQDNIGSNTNISNLQIEDALRILNEDFSKTNPEFPNPPRNTFLSYAGNPDLKFCLATTDPSGNSTNGITRTPTSKSSWDYDTESNDMKQASSGGIDNWDPLRYMNIWVCNLSGGGVLGYAYLPGLQSWDVWKDGLVVDFQYFGTTGGASSNSDGRTPTHEIGHYLGLNHTFAEDGGWNNPCVDSQGNLQCCDNDNGNVNDTPPTDGIYWGNVTAATNNNTCHDDLSYGFSSDLLDMDENYMSYASATWMFSVDQGNVMHATLNGYRSSLKNSTLSMNCSGIIPSWNCISAGNCQDPGNGTGTYPTITDCQTACVTTTINEEIIGLLIYPNPNLGLINIKSKENINTINISNILGKQIFFTKDFSTNTIDLSSLDNGIYFINIRTDKGMHIEKIILSK